MGRLRISDGNPVAERRTSQRTTRSTSRQLNDNVDNQSETTENTSANPGMWTPGTPSSGNKTDKYRSRNSIWIEYQEAILFYIRNVSFFSIQTLNAGK